MKDIKVICDCGLEMAKIEDGRERHTKAFQPEYPDNQMEFACPCGKAIDLVWKESEMEMMDA